MSVVDRTRERRKPRLLESEDWLAVGIAAVAIALILGGVRPELPRVSWSGSGELAGTILGLPNLARALQLGLTLGALSLAGVLLMRGSPGRFALGFSVLYPISLLSLVIAGCAGVAGWALNTSSSRSFSAWP